jgi:hypothetical protein
MDEVRVKLLPPIPTTAQRVGYGQTLRIAVSSSSQIADAVAAGAATITN